MVLAELELPPIEALPLPFKPKYKRFTPIVYSLIGVPLTISIIAFMYVLASTISSIGTVEETAPSIAPNALRLLLFGALYIISSAISSYILFDKLNHHLYYSVLESFLRARRENREVYPLYRASLLRKNTPSPVTALLLCLFLAGLPYPILLWYFEKALREHSRIEEELFIGGRYTGRIDVSNLFLDLILVGITLGLWLCYWSYRATKLYNEHIDRVHRRVVKEPSFTATTPLQGGVFIPATILFATGVYTFLSLSGVPVYPMPIICIASLYAYTVYVFRNKPFIQHVFILLGLEYVILACLGLVGFTGFNYYSSLFEEVEKQLPKTHDPFMLTMGIFQNNLIITLAAIIPYAGVLYTGYALSNTGFLYGIIIGTQYYSGRGLSALLLFIMPHAFLELLAYAIASAIAPRVFSQPVSKSIQQAIIAITILLIAAFVEAVSIILLK